jgi:hypothetical protein
VSKAGEYSALGDLVMHHPEQFGIKDIEYIGL